MTTISRLLLFALLFAPSLASAQSFEVHAPFDPSTYKPLDGRERWQRWWSEDGGSASIHVGVFAVAAVLQADNAPPQWGRNWGGFARREGSEYADFFMSNSVHEGLGAALGDDPRYYPCGCTGFFRRAGHAIEMTVLTYNRNGHKVLDIPQLAGQYTAGMVGVLWWPDHYSPLVQGVQVGHVEMGLIGGIHIVQEFSPELKRLFHAGNKPAAKAPSKTP